MTTFKDTDIIWVDKIPINWEIKKIKFLGKTIAWGTPKTEVTEYWGWDIPWIPSWMVHDCIIDNNEGWKYITLKWLKESSTKEIPKNSPLVALTWATCANVALLKFKATANQSVVALAVNENNKPEYIYYSYLANRKQFLFYQTGWAQWGINLDEVRNISLALPPLQTQTIIANFLDSKTDKISTFIKNKKETIKLLQEQKQAIIHKAVTKGIEEWIKMKDSWILWVDKVPVSWNLNKLKYVSKINPWKTKEILPNTNTVFLPMEMVESDWSINQSILKKTSEVSKWYTYFERNDIVFAKITPCFENWKWALLDNLESEYWFWTTEFHVLRADNEKIINEFLKIIIQSYNFKNIGESFMQGSAWQKRVTTNFLSNFEIYIPSVINQEKIIKYISKKINIIDTAITKIESEIQLIEEYKESLIYNAVTGKINI